jgi:hypothetical protein
VEHEYNNDVVVIELVENAKVARLKFVVAPENAVEAGS